MTPVRRASDAAVVGPARPRVVRPARPGLVSGLTSGFTLVEVMVSLAIMGLVMVAMYQTLNTTLMTRDLLAHEVAAARIGPTILDVVETDLRRAWLMNIEDDLVFRGEARSLLGESADSLAFLTTVDSSFSQRLGEREVTADVCETGYRLRPNPDVPDVLELWRRQDFHVDEEPLEGGVYVERLHDRVIAFEVRYYEDNHVDTEPEEDWDSEERHALPAMISIRLGLEVGPRLADAETGRTRRNVLWYERTIPLPLDAALTMRVHPFPPSLTGSYAAAGSGGAGAGGGAGGGGAGGPGGDGPDGGPGDLGGPGAGPGGTLGGGGDNPFGGVGGGGGGGEVDLEDLLEDLFGGG